MKTKTKIYTATEIAHNLAAEHQLRPPSLYSTLPRIASPGNG